MAFFSGLPTHCHCYKLQYEVLNLAYNCFLVALWANIIKMFALGWVEEMSTLPHTNDDYSFMYNMHTIFSMCHPIWTQNSALLLLHSRHHVLCIQMQNKQRSSHPWGWMSLKRYIDKKEKEHEPVWKRGRDRVAEAHKVLSGDMEPGLDEHIKPVSWA